MTFYVTETRSAYVDIDVTPEQEEAINDGEDIGNVIQGFWDIASTALRDSEDVSQEYDIE